MPSNQPTVAPSQAPVLESVTQEIITDTLQGGKEIKTDTVITSKPAKPRGVLGRMYDRLFGVPAATTEVDVTTTASVTDVGVSQNPPPPKSFARRVFDVIAWPFKKLGELGAFLVIGAISVIAWPFRKLGSILFSSTSKAEAKLKADAAALEEKSKAALVTAKQDVAILLAGTKTALTNAEKNTAALLAKAKTEAGTVNTALETEAGIVNAALETEGAAILAKAKAAVTTAEQDAAALLAKASAEVGDVKNALVTDAAAVLEKAKAAVATAEQDIAALQAKAEGTAAAEEEKQDAPPPAPVLTPEATQTPSKKWSLTKYAGNTLTSLDPMHCCSTLKPGAVSNPGVQPAAANEPASATPVVKPPTPKASTPKASTPKASMA